MVLLFTAAACQPTCSQPAATPVTSPSSSSSSSPSPSISPVAEASPSAPASAVASPVGTVLAVANLPFHSGEVGIAYTPVQVTASGGKPPYQWSITDGTFPPGLSLSTGGTATGTSSQSGKFDFTVHVVDSAGAAANLGSSVFVYAALTTAAYCAGQCSVEQGCVTVCGVFGGASGGLPPYQYTTTSGAAPPGMGLNGLALTGPFPAPGPVGAYSLTIVVTDQYGAQGTVPANWYVFPHIAFTGNGTCTGFVVQGCTTQMQYSGGKPNASPTVQVTQDPKYPPLPSGSTFKASGGVVSISIAAPGCATYGNSGYFAIVSLVLVDQSPCGPGTNCSSGAASLTIRLAVC